MNHLKTVTAACYTHTVICCLHPQIKTLPAGWLQTSHRQNRHGEIIQNASTIFCGDVFESFKCQTQLVMLDKFKARIRENQFTLYQTMQQQAGNDFIGGLSSVRNEHDHLEHAPNQPAMTVATLKS